MTAEQYDKLTEMQRIKPKDDEEAKVIVVPSIYSMLSCVVLCCLIFFSLSILISIFRFYSSLSAGVWHVHYYLIFYSFHSFFSFFPFLSSFYFLLLVLSSTPPPPPPPSSLLPLSSLLLLYPFQINPMTEKKEESDPDTPRLCEMRIQKITSLGGIPVLAK